MIGEPPSPDFVAIGHLSLDVNVVDGGTPGPHAPGGAAAYAALTARGHGMSAGIVTACDDDYPIEDVLAGVDVRVSPSEHTSTFANYYDSGDRSQVLLASGNRIPLTAVPPGL